MWESGNRAEWDFAIGNLEWNGNRQLKKLQSKP
jgi:hypothetical protein